MGMENTETRVLLPEIELQKELNNCVTPRVSKNLLIIGNLTIFIDGYVRTRTTVLYF